MHLEGKDFQLNCHLSLMLLKSVVQRGKLSNKLKKVIF